MRMFGFLLAAGIGSGLWAGLALGSGWLLQGTVQAAIAMLDQHSSLAVLLFVMLLGFWIGWKLWQKYRFRKFCAVPHITPDELIEALADDKPPLLLDLRGATMIAATGPIAGARIAEHDFLKEAVGDWPKDRPIVTLCACPEDASAVQAARHLLNVGYMSVKPLQGGYDAWLAANAKRSDQ